VPPLFDLLAVEERMHLRRLLLQLLIGLAEHTVRDAPLRLRDGRWHVRRNTLYLLAECGARLDPALLEPLSGDNDPRVRLECARCLVLAGEASGASTLRALLHDAGDGVADAAIAAAGAMGVGELLPDLVALVKKPSGSDGVRRRLRAVRALGQLGGEQAAAALRELLPLRVSLFPGETRRFRSEVRRMLARLDGKQPPGETPGEAPAGEAR
jgi:HEAT repeat protein